MAMRYSVAVEVTVWQTAARLLEIGNHRVLIRITSFGEPYTGSDFSGKA